MTWASEYITKLQAGETVTFRPRGHSMKGLIESGELVTVEPIDATHILGKDRIVLCTVAGSVYLHKILDIRMFTEHDDEGGELRLEFQIGNNRGRINGWTPRSNLYGICTKVED